MIILANVQRQFMDCHYQSCIDIFLADVRCLWIVIKIKLLLINGVYILTGRSEYFSMDIEIYGLD